MLLLRTGTRVHRASARNIIREAIPCTVANRALALYLMLALFMAGVRTVRLLVVEDDPGYRYLVERAFSARGEETRWDLTIAKNGEEALHALFEEEGKKSHLPDLILLDWNLPKVSGNEVLRRVKRDQARGSIPVLVFSSSTDDKDIRAAYDDHANGY
jgi:two-component system, chemotaxis family, response regulator Rcp1